jgi:hypothetical protein
MKLPSNIPGGRAPARHARDRPVLPASLALPAGRSAEAIATSPQASRWFDHPR